MKKIFFTLISFFALVNISYGQLNLYLTGEINYNSSKSFGGNYYFFDWTFIDIQDTQWGMDSIITYDNEFNIYSSFPLPYDTINSSDIIYCKEYSLVTQHVFNNDDKLEYVVEKYHYNKNTWEFTKYDILIFDEDGNVLYTLENRSSPGILYGYKDGRPALIVTNTLTNEKETYLLDGTSTGDKSSVVNQVEPLKTYPSPTSNILNVEYDLGNNIDGELIISNINGQVISNERITSIERIKKVDVTHFSKGTYTITIKTKLSEQKSKFIVQ